MTCDEKVVVVKTHKQGRFYFSKEKNNKTGA